MRVMDLEGAQLDRWVAKSAGLKRLREAPAEDEAAEPAAGTWHPTTWHPSTDWSQGGPIVAEDWYEIEDSLFAWFGPDWPEGPGVRCEPLAWFMRAYVAARFGEEIEEPTGRLASELQAMMERVLAGLKRLRPHRGRH